MTSSVSVLDLPCDVSDLVSVVPARVEPTWRVSVVVVVLAPSGLVLFASDLTSRRGSAFFSHAAAVRRAKPRRKATATRRIRPPPLERASFVPAAARALFCHPEVADAPKPLWRRREQREEGSAFGGSRSLASSFAEVADAPEPLWRRRASEDRSLGMTGTGFRAFRRRLPARLRR